MGKMRRLMATGALLAATGLASCGADPADGPVGAGGTAHTEPRNTIAGDVREWAVETTADRAFDGDVTFAITNFGTIKHEFLVVKTDFEPGKIPLTSESRFDEEAEGLEVIDEIPEFEVKTTGMLTVKLDPGKYQLLCNIAGHYKAGMYKAFEVVKGDAPVAEPATEGDGTDADAVSNDLHGSVAEWAVNVDAAKAKAGEVSFTMENRGTIQHEFLVVKTTYEHGMIPLGADNRFDEEDKGLSVIDEIPEWAPGVTNTLKVKLEPGKYELLCNIEGHYKNGMHAAFEVVP